MRALPVLEEYCISPDHGFLDGRLPLTRLTSKKYTRWEEIRGPAALSFAGRQPGADRYRRAGGVGPGRDHIGRRPGELRRAYSVLGFMAHAYVWATGTPRDVLPECVAGPLLHAADILGVPPLATYSSLVLWNFKVADECLQTESRCLDLENITTINTFTGTVDESWFYLVSVRFEKIGSSCLNHGLQILRAIRDGGDDRAVADGLQNLAAAIQKLSRALMEMETKCEPSVFYFKIRPFLAGWTNMVASGVAPGRQVWDRGPVQDFLWRVQRPELVDPDAGHLAGREAFRQRCAFLQGQPEG